MSLGQTLCPESLKEKKNAYIAVRTLKEGALFFSRHLKSFEKDTTNSSFNFIFSNVRNTMVFVVSGVCIKHFFLLLYRRGAANIPRGSESNEYLTGLPMSEQRLY